MSPEDPWLSGFYFYLFIFFYVILLNRLTAFVLRVFCQANELTSIDEAVICKSMKWLSGLQGVDGSFGFTYRTHHGIYVMVGIIVTPFNIMILYNYTNFTLVKHVTVLPVYSAIEYVETIYNIYTIIFF